MRESPNRHAAGLLPTSARLGRVQVLVAAVRGVRRGAEVVPVDRVLDHRAGDVAVVEHRVAGEAAAGVHGEVAVAVGRGAEARELQHVTGGAGVLRALAHEVAGVERGRDGAVGREPVGAVPAGHVEHGHGVGGGGGDRTDPGDVVDVVVRVVEVAADRHVAGGLGAGPRRAGGEAEPVVVRVQVPHDLRARAGVLRRVGGVRGVVGTRIRGVRGVRVRVGRTGGAGAADAAEAVAAGGGGLGAGVGRRAGHAAGGEGEEERNEGGTHESLSEGDTARAFAKRGLWQK